MDEMLSVKQASQFLNKSEETIRRYLRNGKLPNATKESDTEGWRIPINDLKALTSTKTYSNPQSSQVLIKNMNIDDNVEEMVALAYKAVTLNDPTEEMIGLLSYVGIYRTLEILLVMQLSPTKVKNPSAFIKKAISKGWTPDTVAIKNQRKVARKNFIERDKSEYVPSIPFYNWLEE